ncbi:hypothetical protein M9Y10_015148 [Tritrichomonas musculus]|uniref:Uncharacterized protein n=1 Tax=Tritrichomonas musculus TaxID=1915356 RepID=A0ABR2L294_9EUKA
MFGEESVRADQERRARQAQYAADLRKQMEDNESSRNKAFQSSASRHILNLNSNSNQPLPRNTSWAPSQYLGLPTSDETSIQNLNENTAPYSSRPSFNVKQIAEDQIRASSVTDDTSLTTYSKSNNNNNYSNYNNNNNGSNNYNNNSNYNFKIQSQIQSLKSSIERIMSVEIPMRMKSSDEAISSLNSKLENALQLSRDSNQAFRDKLAELSFNYNQVNQKYLDHSEKLRSAVSELRNDFSRNNETSNSRFASIESRLDSIESSIRSISNKQQQIERSLAEQNSALTNAISSAEKNANISDQNIMNQLETLNRETISTFSQVNQAIESSTVGLNESITSLAKDVRESFKIIRTETENEISQLKAQNENSFNEIGKNFSSFQTEVVSTFTTFREIMNSGLETLQDAYTTESKARNDSDQILSSNQKDIVVKFTDQCDSIQKTIEKVESSISPTVDQICNSYFLKWKNELSTFINGTLNSIEGLQTKINENEQKFTEFTSLQAKTNNDVLEQLSIESQAKEQMNAEISGIKNQVDEEINKTDNKFKQNDKKIGQIDNKFKKNDKKIVQIDKKFKQNDEKIGKIDNRLQQNDEIVGHINDKIGQHDTKIGEANDKIVQIDEKLVQFDGRIDQTGNKISQTDEKLGQMDENYQSRLSGIDQEITENIKKKIATLEAQAGTTQATTTINERLDTAIDQIEKLTTKIPSDLTDRLSQVETISSNQSALNQRIAQIETAMKSGKSTKKSLTKPQSPNSDNGQNDFQKMGKAFFNGINDFNSNGSPNSSPPSTPRANKSDEDNNAQNSKKPREPSGNSSSGSRSKKKNDSK